MGRRLHAGRRGAAGAGLPRRGDPLHTSGSTSNEAAFLYQLFVRAFGDPPDCSNLYHESSGVALTETIGVGKGSVALEDLHHAELILVVGQNPGTNHPRMLSALDTAKGNGARIVAVNPLSETGLQRFKIPRRLGGLVGSGSAIADDFLQIRLGGDLALFQAMGRLLVDAEDAAPGTVVDHDFVATHTTGFNQYVEHLRALDGHDGAAATGLERAAIEGVAARLTRSRRTIVCWAMGLTQHKAAVATIREIVNVLLLQGNIGRPGSGVCPLRAFPTSRANAPWGSGSDPRRVPRLAGLRVRLRAAPPPGVDAVEAVRAMSDGRADVFFGLGGNFVAAMPDTLVTAAAGCTSPTHSAAPPAASEEPEQRPRPVTWRRGSLRPTSSCPRRLSSDRVSAPGLVAAV